MYLSWLASLLVLWNRTPRDDYVGPIGFGGFWGASLRSLKLGVWTGDLESTWAGSVLVGVVGLEVGE